MGRFEPWTPRRNAGKALGVRFVKVGAGSTFAWQVFPTIGVDLAKRAAIEFGYRWLDIDYTSGENQTLFEYDVLTQGFVMGFGFRF